jgi:hypothetical protein
MLKNPTGMKRDTSWAKFMAVFHQLSPALLQDVSACYCQTALVHESGMIRIQMGTHDTSQMVAVLGMPCAIPHHNRNSNSRSKYYACHFVLKCPEFTLSMVFWIAMLCGLARVANRKTTNDIFTSTRT